MGGERNRDDKREISKGQSDVHASSLTFKTEGMLSSAKTSRGTQKNRDEIQSF